MLVPAPLLKDEPLHHGGKLEAASEQYGIPVEQWLDLSTGINPCVYPIPHVPERYFHHLPEVDCTQFKAAATAYYGSQNILAASGSQRFIELLPSLRAPCRVALPDVGYQEHLYHWQRNGHQTFLYNGFQPETVENSIRSGDVDVVVLINPCNPTGACVSLAVLREWQQLLSARGGWLLIDEAFIDCSPEWSFSQCSHLPGVIVLRSLGKFFGLAGIRMGFALAGDDVIAALAEKVGPWAISGPSQFITMKALQDIPWQQENRQGLAANSQWMTALLQKYLAVNIQQLLSTDLFISLLLEVAVAETLFDSLARQGILIRFWPMSKTVALLRFGLIAENQPAERQRFEQVLAQISIAVPAV